MSLTLQLDRYLSVRRSLGYDLRTSERILRRFTGFADAEGAAHVNTALFLRWHATLRRRRTADLGGAARRGAAVRAMAERPRSGPRGAAARAAARPLRAVSPVHLQRGRGRRDRRSGGRTAIDLRPARADLLDAVRADRGHRPSDQRGAGARRGDVDLDDRRAARPAREAWQGAAAAARSERGGAAATPMLAERDRLLGQRCKAAFRHRQGRRG